MLAVNVEPLSLLQFKALVAKNREGYISNLIKKTMFRTLLKKKWGIYL